MKSVYNLEKKQKHVATAQNLGPKGTHRFRLKVPEMQDHVATTQNRQITEIRTAKSCVGELMPWGPSFFGQSKESRNHGMRLKIVLKSRSFRFFTD